MGTAQVVVVVGTVVGVVHVSIHFIYFFDISNPHHYFLFQALRCLSEAKRTGTVNMNLYQSGRHQSTAQLPLRVVAVLLQLISTALHPQQRHSESTRPHRILDSLTFPVRYVKLLQYQYEAINNYS